jgi:hypothetical protein
MMLVPRASAEIVIEKPDLAIGDSWTYQEKNPFYNGEYTVKITGTQTVKMNGVDYSSFVLSTTGRGLYDDGALQGTYEETGAQYLRMVDFANIGAQSTMVISASTGPYAKITISCTLTFDKYSESRGYPFRVGDKWTTDLSARSRCQLTIDSQSQSPQYNSGSCHVLASAVSEEKVNVPAGTFDSLYVTYSECIVRPWYFVTEAWFSPDTGLAPKERAGYDSSIELKRFSYAAKTSMIAYYLIIGIVIFIVVLVTVFLVLRRRRRASRMMYGPGFIPIHSPCPHCTGTLYYSQTYQLWSCSRCKRTGEMSQLLTGLSKKEPPDPNLNR